MRWRLPLSPFIDLMIECTGDPVAAVDHIAASFACGKDVVNVTVEADSIVVPALPNGPATPGFSIRLPMATSRR